MARAKRSGKGGGRVKHEPTLGELFEAAKGSTTPALVGQRIVEARGRRGLSQAALAMTADISRTVLNGYEKGRRLPGLDQARRLCDALKLDPNKLVYGETAPPEAQSASEMLSPEYLRNVLPKALLVIALAPSEQDAVAAILRALVDARIGRAERIETERAIEVIAEQLAANIPKFEETINAAVPTPDMKRLIGSQVTPVESKQSPSRRR